MSQSMSIFDLTYLQSMITEKSHNSSCSYHERSEFCAHDDRHPSKTKYVCSYKYPSCFHRRTVVTTRTCRPEEIALWNDAF